MKRWVILLAIAGCAHAVTPDLHTGADGDYTGAGPIELHDGVADVAGDVSYPGGDRVDWLAVHLPADHVGQLELMLHGRHVQMRVYDQWGRGRGCCWGATVMGATGTVYVLVYARNRDDAGRYRLHVEYTPEPPPPDYSALEVPQPPRLAAVPPPAPPPPPPPPPTPCDPDHLDPTNPACLPTRPLYDDCARLQNCPEPPEPPEPTELTGDIIAIESSGGRTVIGVNHGTKDGVDTHWSGEIIGLHGSDFLVFKVTNLACYATVKLDKEIVEKSGMQVRLSPPVR